MTTKQVQFAKILIKPRFLIDGKYYFLNDVDIKKAKNVIGDILKKNVFNDLLLIAAQPIRRVVGANNIPSNFYFIDSGDYLSYDELQPYFKKLQEYNARPAAERNVSIEINKDTPTVADLDFYKFDDLPRGLHNGSGKNITKVYEITDVDLANDVIQKQLSTPEFIAQSADLSTLPIDNVYFERGALLLGANFSGTTVKASEFMFVSLICANFTKSTVSQSFFDDADLRYANFYGSVLTKNNFQHANLSGAVFETATITDMLCHMADFKYSNCKGATFTNCDFRVVDFSGANLTGAVFVDCDFGLANFKNTNLTRATFEGSKTNFFGVKFEEAIITKSTKFPDSVDLQDIVYEPEFEFVGQPKKSRSKKTKKLTVAASTGDMSAGGKRKKSNKNRRLSNKRSQYL